jgi:hypothetical protein
MKINLKTIALALAFGSIVTFTACSDDEPAPLPAPTISGLEIGDSNSMKATIGGDLHLDAEIVAEARIERIKVELHPEGEMGEDIEEEYTSYAGQKNADFHEDLEIPSTAVAGEYHFHMTVIDQEGNSTSVEADVMIE